MKHLDIHETQADGAQALLSLSAALSRLPRRARRSFWTVADVLWNNRVSELWVVLDDEPNRLEMARDTQTKLKYRELLDIAREGHQVIWVKLSAFDEKADEPWLVMSAIDGGFWRINTEDTSAEAWVIRNFNSVRISNR